jgi:starch phosphorylase
MNGALTIGTFDGANAEIREEVGTDQFFLFGLNVQEAADLVQNSYRPLDYYNRNPELKKAIDLISSGHFSHGDQQLFKPVIDELLYNDRYLLMADYESYINCHDKIGSVFEDHQIWTRMSILNVARMGRFSSDRAIQEYCRSIWHVEPFPVELKWKRIPEGGIIFPIIAQ